MSRFVMLTDPAIFVARGLSLEAARAEALQADRAIVLQRMHGFEPRRWFTHAELPEDPYKPADSAFCDPWNEPGDLCGTPQVFGEGLFSRAMRVLILRDLAKRFAKSFREAHYRELDMEDHLDAAAPATTCTCPPAPVSPVATPTP